MYECYNNNSKKSSNRKDRRIILHFNYLQIAIRIRVIEMELHLKSYSFIDSS